MITREQLTQIRDDDLPRFESAGRAIERLLEDDHVFKSSLAMQIWVQRLGLIVLTTINRQLKANMRDAELGFAVLRETHEAFKTAHGFTVKDLENSLDDLVKPWFDLLAVHNMYQMQEAPDDARSPDAGSTGDGSPDAGTAGEALPAGAGGSGTEIPAEGDRGAADAAGSSGP
jgi:hypothetical protein